MYINVKTETTFRVYLPYDSMEDISTDVMSVEESDDIILNAIFEQHKAKPDSIFVKGD